MIFFASLNSETVSLTKKVAVKQKNPE